MLIIACIAFIPATLVADEAFWGSDFGSLFSATARGLTCYTAGMLVHERYGDTPVSNHWLAFIAPPVFLVVGEYSPRGLFPTVFGLAVAQVILRMAPSYRGNDWALGMLSFPLYAVNFPLIMLAYLVGSPAWVAAKMVLAGAALAARLLETPRRFPFVSDATPALQAKPVQ